MLKSQKYYLYTLSHHFCHLLPCCQMVQTHGSVQLSMGATMHEGLIDDDTPFQLQLLPGVDRKPRTQTITTVREVLSIMEINEKRVWICVLMGSNGTMTGYFSSLVEEIKEHVATFVHGPIAREALTKMRVKLNLVSAAAPCTKGNWM